MIRQIDNTVAPLGKTQAPRVSQGAGQVDFRRVFEGVIRPEPKEVRLSAHARERLRERSIELGENDMARLTNAAEKVASKGGKDALVVMDGLGFILDVANRTVVTAIDRQRLQENVFTNIDSAVFA
jgi:flagellar operon protein